MICIVLYCIKALKMTRKTCRNNCQLIWNKINLSSNGRKIKHIVLTCLKICCNLLLTLFFCLFFLIIRAWYRSILIVRPYRIFVRFKLKIIRNIYQNKTTNHLIQEWEAKKNVSCLCKKTVYSQCCIGLSDGSTQNLRNMTRTNKSTKKNENFPKKSICLVF
jgi:hypothetical protein